METLNNAATSEKRNDGFAASARWPWITAGIAAALVAAAVLFLESAFLRNILERRIVAALTITTGARVELTRFSFQPFRMELDISGLKVHGREPSHEPPLFSAEMVQINLRLRSLWSGGTRLRSLRIWNPQINIEVNEAGETNLPVRPVVSTASNWIERIMDAEVGRVEAIRGQVHYRSAAAEWQAPLDFRAENVQFGVNYESSRGGYLGSLDSQKILLSLGNSPPLNARGRARVSVRRDRVDIESMDLQTAGSRLSIQAVVGNLADPRVQFQYDLHMNAPDIAAFLRRSTAQGVLDWKGQGSFRPGEWFLEGPLAVNAPRAVIAGVASAPLSARGDLRLSNAEAEHGMPNSASWHAELTHLEIQTLGGQLAGTASMEKRQGAPAGTVDLQAQRISVPALLAAVPSLRSRLADVRWAGSLSGKVRGDFTGKSERLSGTMDLRIDPPPVLPPGFEPVSGSLHARFDGATQRIDFDHSSLSLPYTTVLADGWLSTENSRMAVSVESARFESTRSMLGPLLKIPESLPVNVRGRANCNLNWEGGAKSPHLSGTVHFSDFDYRGTRWDGFSGNIDFHQFTPLSVPANAARARSRYAQPTRSRASTAELKITSGRLSRGSSLLRFNTTIGISGGAIDEDAPFTAEGTLQNASLEDLQGIAGTRYPIRGSVQSSFQASGRMKSPQGRGTITINHGELYGESFDSLTAEFHLQPGPVVSAEKVEIQRGRGILRGNGEIGLASKQYKAALTGSNLALESFEVWKKMHVAATGVAQVKLSGAGDLAHPTLQAQLDVSRLAFAGEKDGRVSLGINAGDDRAHAQWTAKLADGDFQGEGDLLLRDQFRFSAHSTFQNADPAVLLSGMGALPKQLQARADGDATAAGDLHDLKAVHIEGQLKTLSVTAASVAFQNPQPVRFTYENSALNFEKLRLVGKDSDLTAAGTIRFAPEAPIDVTVKGNADLGALNALDPQLGAMGQAVLDARFSGTLRRPLWRGRLDFSDVALRYGTLPNGLSAVKGSLLFDGNRATLQNVTAESGGGTLKLDGFLTYLPETGFGTQLSAEIRDVRVRYPEGVSTWLGGRLTLNGTAKSSTLGGRLVILKEAAAQGLDVGAALMSHSQQPLLPPMNGGFLKAMRLDVQIVSATNVALETTTAKNLRGDVDLRIQGSLDHPSWLGRISILQGEISIGGRKYLADRGELTFSNPFRIEPILDLQVRARIEQYDINLHFTGPLDHLALTYSSDPPLPTSEILALLVAGSSYGTNLTSASSGSTAQLGAESLLSSALNQQVGNRLDRIFGSGHIRIDPQIAGFDKPANANIALEQHIKDNLTLLYVTNVTAAQQRIIQAEWSLSPRFSITANRDENGLIGVNFQIKLRFR